MDNGFVNHSASVGADNGPNVMINAFHNILMPAMPDMNVTIPEEGREYYWKAVNDMKIQWADDDAIKLIINEMNELMVKCKGSR